MRIARRLGWVARIPDEWPSVARDPAKKGQRGELHPREVLAKWVTAIADVKARDAARLYLSTGLRKEEMQRLSLSWMTPLPKPIDKNGVKLVAVIKVPDWASKTRDEREVLIDQESVDAIERQATKLPEKVDRTTTPCMAGTFRKAWWSACKAVGYGKRITARDLRHAARTYGASFSGDPESARHALGHTNERTSALYDHASSERLAGFAAGVQVAVFGTPLAKRKRRSTQATRRATQGNPPQDVKTAIL